MEQYLTNTILVKYNKDQIVMGHFNTTVFYLSIPPGLEEIAQIELLEKWHYIDPSNSIPQLTLTNGGIEFISNLHQGVWLNLILKIPTRILIRLDSFRCRDFPKLFKKLQKIEWIYFLTGQDPEVKVSAHNSRLFDSRRITKCAIDAITKYYRANTPPSKYLETNSKIEKTTIYLRFINDICTLSIDTTGDRLNIRSYRKFTTAAPIRENIAAALIYKLSTYSKSLLIDPMCGSGTFLIESILFNSVIDSREYSFYNFPILEKINQELKPILSSASLFLKNMGFDHADDVLEIANKNISTIEHFSNQITIEKKDLFDNSIYHLPDTTVIINPPYGKRITIEEESIRTYYSNLLIQIKIKFAPKIVGIICPAEIFGQFKIDKYFSLVETISFSNGGISVRFLILKRQHS